MIRVSETLAFTARLPASQAVCVTRRLAAAASSTAAVDIMAGKLKNSSLLTPDPYHVPGYCGYVPQFKYKLGETFGWHTHKLLTDQSVASSGVPILANTSFPSVPSHDQELKRTFSRVLLVVAQGAGVTRNMLHKWCPDTLVCFLLLLIHSFLCSFLLGYIPKGHNHFGCRYAEACHYAITSFEDEYHKHEAKMSGIKGTSRTPLTSPQSLDTPLKPIAARPNAVSPCLYQAAIWPY